MAKDLFQGTSVSRNDSLSNGHRITPSDTAEFPFRPRYVLVVEGGTIMLEMYDGDGNLHAVPHENVPNWTQLPFVPNRVLATGTDANVKINIYA